MDKPTHILVTYKQQKSTLLFRAEDGILCCMQQNAVCVFGDGPKNKDSHTFIDTAAAMEWIGNVYPAKDLKARSIEGAPVIEERDGEGHGLWTPEDSIELPGFGPHMSPVGKKFQ